MASWKALPNFTPSDIGTSFLLTDGSLMIQNSDDTSKWWRVTPDLTGSYVTGTVKACAPMKHKRTFFPSAVLRDGSLVCMGGEYTELGEDLLAGERYYPDRDEWVELPMPSGWTAMGDAPCTVLRDGRFLVAWGYQVAIYDPVANSWTAAADKPSSSSEESFLTLSDGSVLTVSCRDAPGSLRYFPDSNTWVSAGDVPVELVEKESLEIGPALLLPDGRALFVGATGNTAYFSRRDGWKAGPAFPKDPVTGFSYGCKDAPGVLLPDGKVLVPTARIDHVASDFLGPVVWFLIDTMTDTILPVEAPPGNPYLPYQVRMLILPNSDVLVTGGSGSLALGYAYKGTPIPGTEPRITGCSSYMFAHGHYVISGDWLGGKSNGSGYGDDCYNATDYPLVSLMAKNGSLYWAKVGLYRKDAMPENLIFEVPNVPTGDYDLRVTANGISSKPQAVSVEGTDVATLVPGDLDLDGKVTLVDVAILMRHLAGFKTLTPQQKFRADFNGDGVVSVADAVGMMKKIAGFG